MLTKKLSFKASSSSKILGPLVVMKVKSVLVDLSGTLHIEDDPVPGAVEALSKLRQQGGVKVRFVTNTTKESKRALLERLNKIGFWLQGDEIFTSLSAARKLIVERELRPFFMVDEAAMEDFSGIPRDDPNAVVIGMAPDQMNYDEMNVAMRLLLKGATLIAIHKARYYKRSDGLALGPGPFVTALEYATGTQSVVVGKPTNEFFMSSIKDFGCDPSECVMIGDDASDDISGAQDVGMKGVLVQTGKYREGDEDTIQPPPYKVVPSFSQAVDEVLRLCQ